MCVQVDPNTHINNIKKNNNNSEYVNVVLLTSEVCFWRPKKNGLRFWETLNPEDKIWSFRNILLLKVRTSLLFLQKSGLTFVSKQFLLFVQTPKYFLFVALLIILFIFIFWVKQVNWRNIDRRDLHVCFLLFFLKYYFPWTYALN
jgi:hypothetical protein